MNRDPKELPTLDGERGPNWIPINQDRFPTPPEGWTPEAGESDRQLNRRGQPSSTEKVGNIADRIQRLMQKAGGKHQIMLAAQEKMAGCQKGSEPCDHNGWINMPGDRPGVFAGRFECDRKTIFCRTGRREYVSECHRILYGHGFRGRLAEACLLREAEHESVMAKGNPLILDDLSRSVYKWVIEGGLQENPLLMLIGKAGPGKTHCALAAMAHFQVTTKKEGKLFNAVRLFRGNGTRDAMLEAAMQAEFLILDDVGQEINSDVNRANLYMVIDARVSSQLPTIITTNLNLGELVSHYDEERIYDRLFTFESFETTATSKRHLK